MKGLKIEKAKPSNSIDIYALIKAEREEGLIPNLSDRMLKQYYFSALLNQLADHRHLFFIAKRGRGYLGYVHAVIVPDKWGSFFVGVDSIFVVKHRRKNGVGRKLLDELKKEVQNIGIKRIEFACPLDQVEYWSKERKAKHSQAIMEVNL